MKMKCLRIATLVAMVALTTQSTYAWDVVFDPSNFSQNVITAAKAVKR